MGTIILIALYGGYLMLFVVLAGFWLWRPAVRWSANSDAAGRSLLDITDAVPITGGDNPAARRQGSAEQPSLQCSFCGKIQAQVAKLIAGPSVYICDECVTAGLKVLRSTLPREPDDRPPSRHVVAALDRAVEGHRDAKLVLAVAAWRHAGCCHDRWWQGHELRFDALLVGATATTRRRLIEALADAYDVPLIALDAAEMLAAGDRMAVLNAVFTAVFQPYWDCPALPPCILFVDNMDRIGKWPAAGSFQRTLVGIVDGRRSPAWDLWGAPVVESSQVQLVCGGAFTGFGQVGRRRGNRGHDGLGRFGIGQFLADRLPCIAVLDRVGKPLEPTASPS